MTGRVVPPDVDAYLATGCMRCKLGGTPSCKVHTWEQELNKVRETLLSCGLTEEVKWSQPCYTYQKRIIAIMSAFKQYCAVGFFKGSLLTDAAGILVSPGQHTQAGRQIRFTSLEDVIRTEPLLREYLREAIELERSAAKPVITRDADAIPLELQAKLDQLPDLRAAFESLTPGRQRSYILYVSAPKRAETRESRVLKCMETILSGKGLYD